MRRAVALGVAAVLLAVGAARAQTSSAETVAEEPSLYQPVGTMNDLMVKIVLPASDAILYISGRTPENDAQWEELQGKALMLAESANLLMLPGRARDRGQWIEDSKLMLEVGRAAFAAALGRDVDGLTALNEPLYNSCVVCHEHYEVTPGGGR